MEVYAITALDLRLGGKAWDFAHQHRPAIDAHWRRLVAERPTLWNGEVLICLEAAITGQTLRARFATTDYASFVAWRDWGTPDREARNCFGTPVVLTADRAIIFGEMAGQTLNAGRLYPPSGSLEPRDVKSSGEVDLLGSIAIELAEETGLDSSHAAPGLMLAIFDEHRLAVARALRFPHTADEMAAIFARRGDAHAELTRLHALRSAGEVTPAMPGFAQEIVRRFEQWFEGR